MYHWTIDGITACTSPLTCTSLAPSTTCSYQSREEVEEAISKIKSFYEKHGFSGFVFEAVEHGCPQPDSQGTYESDLASEAYQSGLRKAVELSDDPAELERRLIEAGILPSSEDLRAAEESAKAHEVAYEKHKAAKEAVQRRLRPEWY